MKGPLRRLRAWSAVVVLSRRGTDIVGVNLYHLNQAEIGPDAVALLARHATGSFRDALGTLEQLVTYGGREVKLEDVLDILGVADAEMVLESAEALAQRDRRLPCCRSSACATDDGRHRPRRSLYVRELTPKSRETRAVAGTSTPGRAL
mgnify:CR=1 FL=1